MARAYFRLFYDQYLPLMTRLSEAEAGRLFVGMMRYLKEDTEPDLPGAEGIIWPLLKEDIDRDRRAYEAKCAANVEAGRKSGEARRARAAEQTAAQSAEKEHRGTNVNERSVNEHTATEPNQAKESKESKKSNQAYQAQKAYDASKSNYASRSKQAFKAQKAAAGAAAERAMDFYESPEDYCARMRRLLEKINGGGEETPIRGSS